MDFEKRDFNQENSLEDNEKRRKEEEWKKLRKMVDEMKDKLGREIDEGIKETVVAFLAFDFNTFASCEGHLDHGLPYPWVEIRIPAPKGWKGANEEKKKELKEEWNEKILKKEAEMLKLLDEFYQKRKEVPYSIRLVINELAWGFRVQGIGSKVAERLMPEKKRERLELLQKEMQAFTQFLKEKFFSRE